MPRLSVDLDKQLYKRFDEICKAKHRKKAEVIRELIERWLESWEEGERGL